MFEISVFKFEGCNKFLSDYKTSLKNTIGTPLLKDQAEVMQKINILFK